MAPTGAREPKSVLPAASRRMPASPMTERGARMSHMRPRAERGRQAREAEERKKGVKKRYAGMVS